MTLRGVVPILRNQKRIGEPSVLAVCHICHVTHVTLRDVCDMHVCPYYSALQMTVAPILWNLVE